MRKVFLISSLVLIGIIAPILACSDNSGKPGISALEAAADAPEVANDHLHQDTGTAAQLIPWSETKNLSSNEINQILQQKPTAEKPSGH